MRQCPKCKRQLELSLDNFGRSSQTKNGFQTYCRACKKEQNKQQRASKQNYVTKNKDKVRAAKTKWRENNPEHWPKYYEGNKDRYYRNARRSMLRKFYTISIEDFDNTKAAQGFSCAICGVPEDEAKLGKFQVDHDHSCCSGKKSCGKCLRGLLCYSCNIMLGAAKDRRDLLLKAVEYLNNPPGFLKVKDGSVYNQSA